MQTPEQVEERLASICSPDTEISDPTRRRTEIYMKADDYKEHHCESDRN